VLRTLKSVLDIDKPHKRWKKESESEITMCDRMQMYNIYILRLTRVERYHSIGVYIFELHSQHFQSLSALGVHLL
jgi:hypothetical protein